MYKYFLVGILFCVFVSAVAIFFEFETIAVWVIGVAGISSYVLTSIGRCKKRAVFRRKLRNINNLDRD